MEKLLKTFNSMYDLVKEYPVDIQYAMASMLFEEIAKANGDDVREVFKSVTKASEQIYEVMGKY